MSGRLALAALAIVAGVGGLTGCDDSVRFRLRIEWQRNGLAQACPTTGDNEYTCAAIPVSCDLRVRVRIVSASSGQTHYFECFTVQSDGTACQLADLAITPHSIPNEMVRVQVIVWTEQEIVRSGVDLTQTDGCPVTTEFNIGGLPRLGEDPTGQPVGVPVPALGGETYFSVGDSPVATVTLGCPRWDSLDAASCQQNAIPFEVSIKNPATFGSVDRMDADDMTVHFGQPVSPAGNGRYRVDLSEEFFTEAPDYTTSGSLVWQGTLFEPPTGTRCVRVDMQGVAAPTITCFPIASTDPPIRVEGFLLDRDQVRALLILHTLQDLPPEGMVFGVVIDAAGNRVPGATVSTTGTAQVVYPADNLQTVGFTSTSSMGYFLSRDAPYESVWRANVPGGFMGDGDARGGLVDNHVTFVVIQLTGVVPPPIDAGLGGGDPDAGVDAP